MKERRCGCTRGVGGDGGGERAASAESAGDVQLRQAAAVREGTVEALWAAYISVRTNEISIQGIKFVLKRWRCLSVEV